MKQKLQNTWVLTASILLNVLLVVAFLFTLYKAQTYYKQYRVYRPMAHGTSEASDFTPAADQSQKLLVMYGDSRIQDWIIPPTIKDTLVVNAGVGGETVIEMRRRLQRDVLRLNPDMVLIQVGMNDLTAAATRGMQHPDKLIKQMKIHLRQIVDILIKENITVILTPVIPAKPLNIARRAFWRNDIDSLLADANIYLKGLADENNLLWVDLLEPLYDEKGNLRTDWYFNTLHLHTETYKSLNTLVERSLNPE